MTFKLNLSLCKTLVLLMDRGDILFDENTNEYIGINGKGFEVVLGSNPDKVEKYLVKYPDPSNW